RVNTAHNPLQYAGLSRRSRLWQDEVLTAAFSVATSTDPAQVATAHLHRAHSLWPFLNLEWQTYFRDKPMPGLPPSLLTRAKLPRPSTNWQGLFANLLRKDRGTLAESTPPASCSHY